MQKWILPIYWLGCVFATHWPTKSAVPLPYHIDKFAHFCMFAVLAWLFAKRFKLTSGNRYRTYSRAIMILAAYAGLDELTQPYFSRTAEWADFAADISGICLGFIAYRRP